MDGACGIGTALRRLLYAVGAVCALSLFSSAPALAQSLGSVTGGVADSAGAVAQKATAPVAQTAAPVVQQTTAPAAQATAPVVQQAAPVVQQVAPVVQQATAPVKQIAAPLVEPVTTAVARTAAPIREAAAPAVNALAPVVGKTAGPTTSQPPVGVVGSGSEVPVAPATDEVSTAGSTSSVVESIARGRARTATSRPNGTPSQLLANVLPTFESEQARTARGGTDDETSSVARRAPRLPGLPSAPLVPKSSFAPPSGGSAPIFVAALVAALLLAAPGLSRRLRLNLAPWPLPIALPSLERPG